jgi:hypothetical protein
MSFKKIISLTLAFSTALLMGSCSENNSVMGPQPVDQNSTSGYTYDKDLNAYIIGDDMIFQKDDSSNSDIIAEIEGKVSLAKKGVIKSGVQKWPLLNVRYSDGSILKRHFIPFFFDPKAKFTSMEKVAIKSAMISLENLTKVDFSDKSSAYVTLGSKIYNQGWLQITRSTDPLSGGSATVGKVAKPVYRVKLTKFSTVAHELLHVLGFGHEMQRPDRDKYVIIYKNNIIEGKEHNFNKFEKALYTSKPYDYLSIMHYRTNAFGKDGKITIKARNGSRLRGDDLTTQDIASLKAHYN